MENETNTPEPKCCELKKSLDKIRAATDRILNLEDLVVGLPNSHVALYKTEAGSIIGECLHNAQCCAVMRAVCTAGSRIARHQHDEIEWVIITSGSMEFNGQTYKAGQGICMLPGEGHDAYFPEDTVCICITIPASPAYPKVR